MWRRKLSKPDTVFCWLFERGPPSSRTASMGQESWVADWNTCRYCWFDLDKNPETENLMGEGTIAATMGQRKKLKHTEGSYLSNAVPQAACCVLHQQAERTAKAEPKNNNNDKKKKKKKNWNDSEKAICYLEEFKGFKKMIFDQSFFRVLCKWCLSINSLAIGFYHATIPEKDAERSLSERTPREANPGPVLRGENLMLQTEA